jgi:hypothetical protein
MQYMPGVFIGRAFDSGYLYVSPTRYVPLLLTFVQSSYDRDWIRRSSDVDVHAIPNL